jgi:ribosomal protein S18 acetylase RimI-like enzyme
MYALWGARCLREGKVVVPSDDLCGFVAVRGHGQSADVELVYVAPEGRGRGLATAMVTKAALAFPASEVRVATQAGNVTAQRLYQSVGFRSRSSNAVLHLWLDGNG